MIVNWQVTFIWFSIGVSHAQLMRNYNDHHRQLLTEASAAPPMIGQANYFIPIANNYRDVGGKVISSWSYFQPAVLVSYTDHRDLHVDDVLPAVAPVANLLVAPFRVQGDVLAKADVEAAKAANVADPVRMKRKNILRYRNGEFRPRLCSPRLCLSVRPP